MDPIDDSCRASRRVNRNKILEESPEEKNFSINFDELDELFSSPVSETQKDEGSPIGIKSTRRSLKNNQGIEESNRSKVLRGTISPIKKSGERRSSTYNIKEIQNDKKTKVVEEKPVKGVRGRKKGGKQAANTPGSTTPLSRSKSPNDSQEFDAKDVKRKGKAKKDTKIEPEKPSKNTKATRSKSVESDDDRTPQNIKKRGGNEPKKGKKEESLEDEVLNYLESQNRPYSIINIFDNLRAKIPKKDLQNILDQLCSSGQIIAKEFGKSIVYFPNQKNIEVNQQALEDAKVSFNKAKDRFDDAKRLNKELKAKLFSIEAIPTTEALLAKADKLSCDIPVFKEKIDNFRDNESELLDPSRVKDCENDILMLEKMRNVRRKMLKGMIDALLESTGWNKKKIEEKIGITI